MPGPGPAAVAACALTLFLLWSNSFIAIAYLLGAEGGAARFDWVSLTAARFLLCAVLGGGYCLAFRAREAEAIVRRRWRRLLLAGFFCVPSYNLALYYGQQHGVPAPVASLTTALAPLFLMLWGALFLGEPPSRRKAAGFLVSLGGLWLISRARAVPGQSSYPLLILVTALAPLSWSIYSALSKPAMRDGDPVLWTYLSLVAGVLPWLPLAPWAGLGRLAALDGLGWLALAFLVLLCTIYGFAAWAWLLRHLPASSVGFTVFLNPPLTTASKWLWAALFPAAFAFQIKPQEWAGGAVALAGLAIAVLKFPRRSS